MNNYLDEVKVRYSKKTYEEKRTVFRRFIAFTKYPMETPVEEIDRAMIRNFFRHMANTISGNAANKARKNLGAAWRWGERNVDDWPNVRNLFLAMERFKEEKKPRYVPPEEDFWKVYHLAEEQDQIMLLAFFHLGARRNELFQLKWSHIDFSRKQVYLQTRKRDGGLEGDWIPITEQLSQKLIAWVEKRQSMIGVDKEYIFICLAKTAFCEEYYGLPFRKRLHFMRKSCERAGVKPFGFHSIRHLFASKLWRQDVSLGHIQQLLRHQSPRVTEKYLQSLGLEKVRKSLELTFNPAGEGELEKAG